MRRWPSGVNLPPSAGTRCGIVRVVQAAMLSLHSPSSLRPSLVPAAVASKRVVRASDVGRVEFLDGDGLSELIKGDGVDTSRDVSEFLDVEAVDAGGVLTGH